MSERLSPDQVKVVLRRASELANARSRERAQTEAQAKAQTQAQADAVSAAEVEEIAADVGIPAEAVRRALAESRSGILPMTVEPPTILDRTIGDEEFAIQRSIIGNVASVRAHLARFMETQVMTIDRDSGEKIVWRRAAGLLGGARRFFGKVMGESIGFLEGMEIETSLIPEGEKVLVVFKVRAARLRRGRISTIAVGGVLGGLLIFLGLYNGGVITGLEAFSIVAGGAASIGAFAQQRGKFKGEMAQARLVCERFLDALERGR